MIAYYIPFAYTYQPGTCPGKPVKKWPVHFSENIKAPESAPALLRADSGGFYS